MALFFLSRENVWRTFEGNLSRFLVNRAWPGKNQLSSLGILYYATNRNVIIVARSEGGYKGKRRIRAFVRDSIEASLISEGYIRRITYSRQRKGLLAHYAGDVGVAARWARRHHGQVAHDLQHFYPGQHRETSHRCVATWRPGMEEEEEVHVVCIF